MEGKGRLFWPDGVEYRGKFKQDRFHGQGLYRWADGKIYNGKWFEGKQHGEGSLIHGNKVKIGKWNMGEREKEWIKEITESQSEIESQLNQSLVSGFQSFFASKEGSIGGNLIKQKSMGMNKSGSIGSKIDFKSL